MVEMMASEKQRNRELVVRLDYAAWRAAVLTEFRTQPGFEALTWHNGQKAVVRFENDAQAAAVVSSTAHKHIVQAPLEVLPSDTEATTTHCVLSNCHQGPATDYRWLVDAHCTGGASGVLRAVCTAISFAETSRSSCGAMPVPCRARLVFEKSDVPLGHLPCAYLVLGFMTPRDADTAVTSTRSQRWACAPSSSPTTLSKAAEAKRGRPSA